jgi:hypothetical protein
MPLQMMFQDDKMIPLASLGPQECDGMITLPRKLLNRSTQIKFQMEKMEVGRW